MVIDLIGLTQLIGKSAIPALPKPASVPDAHKQAKQWAARVLEPEPSTATQDTTEIAEMSTEELMRDLQADAENEDSDFDDNNSPDIEEEVWGKELSLSTDGNCPSNWEAGMSDDNDEPDTPPSTISNSYHSFADIALDSSDILADLPTSESDDDDIDLREFVSSASSLVDNDPQRTTTMMELQSQEDALVLTLQHLGVSREKLSAHISPSIGEQLFGTTPEELESAAVPNIATTITPRERSTSSPIIHYHYYYCYNYYHYYYITFRNLIFTSMLSGCRSNGGHCGHHSINCAVTAENTPL
ncbi:hypothetical protein B0H16DRAFT_1460698 [Mycena metata]|uniref:Uncharacterized protein n=1 Tax=Mycena metata TaxID=1033252 RepID=A0AAD7N964_9AGAR|nr:hypothetical protein B0H16DRAFT_1460698 [Mycena metata]